MDDPTVICPRCLLPYGFIRCRISQYDKDGKRYERCMKCAIEEDKLSTKE